MHNQRPITSSNTYTSEKQKKTLEAFKNALKCVQSNRIDRQSANHDEQLEKTS